MVDVDEIVDDVLSWVVDVVEVSIKIQSLGFSSGSYLKPSLQEHIPGK